MVQTRAQSRAQSGLDKKEETPHDAPTRSSLRQKRPRKSAQDPAVLKKYIRGRIQNPLDLEPRLFPNQELIEASPVPVAAPSAPLSASPHAPPPASSPASFPASSPSSSPASSPASPHTPPPPPDAPPAFHPAAPTTPVKAETTNPIDFWRRKGRWPSQLFDPGMERMYARKGALSTTIIRKGPNSTIYSQTPSDQRPRQEKSAQYSSAGYEVLLKTHGVYMEPSRFHLPVAEESRKICKDLLDSDQPVPSGTIFDEAVAEKALANLRGENEARIIQDISRLLVPSAETLALRKHNSDLILLVESVNRAWSNCIPLLGSRPQPDYSVAFESEAFSREQLQKLSPLVGDIGDDASFILGSCAMYFPFLTCEVKCGAQALEIADRQNVHSMTLAVRAVAEVFRNLGRENEVNRQILAWSISHNHEVARIYGLYPIIEGDTITYHRHVVKYCFLHNPEDRWTTYRFTRNIYDIWVPAHLKRLRSAIDQMTLVSDEGPSHYGSTGLPQSLENPGRPEARPGPASSAGDQHGKSRESGRTPTPTTSRSEPLPAKKRKLPVEEASRE